jgi:hypothetical protein
MPPNRRAQPGNTVVTGSCDRPVAVESCIAIRADMHHRALCTGSTCRTNKKHGFSGIHTWNSQECESAAGNDVVMLSMELMPTEAHRLYPRGNARRIAGGTMPDLDIAWLIREFDDLGLKLTATPRLDGSFGLNRWRTISYWDNAAQAESLWAEHVGDDPQVIAALAAHIGAGGIDRVEAPPATPLRRHG